MRNLFEMARAAASRDPERIALEHSGHQLSYGDLIAHASAFAGHLLSAGLAPGDFAALMLDNSIEYAIALLGIWASGAGAVPLSPETSEANLQKILADCRAPLLIARNRTLDRLASKPATIALSPNLSENLARFGKALHSTSSADMDDLAMLLYTSGTSGRAKGVMLTHRNLIANTRSIIDYLRLTSADSIVNVLPWAHSFGNSVLLTHLAAGAKIIVENRFAFPDQVVQTMQSAQPTGFAGVPTTFYILIHKSTFLLRQWSFLRYISQAGGAMRVETIKQLRQALPDTAIYIMYGQTEASARLSFLSPELVDQKPGSIGKAIPGVELDLVDVDSTPVEDGELGEIVARGENIMRGYLNDPEGTVEALRGGWLHTGDMARRDAQGDFTIVSRKSDFIKSAGHRIAPGEVEEVIAAAIPSIEDVAVIAVPDEVLGEAVAACVSCPADKFDAAAILRACHGRLSLHKIPKHVIHDNEIPRTVSGKKQYYLLREKYQSFGR
jgi:long-chain acyl-CoA synthetase